MIIQYLLTYNRYLNLIGIAVILGIAWLFSHHRSRINYAIIIRGLALQTVIGLFMLRTTIGQRMVMTAGYGVHKLYQCAQAGIGFIFGDLIHNNDTWGFIFGIQILPVLIFFGAFMAILYHWGIIQRMVNIMSYLICPLLGTSGTETLSVVGISFLGQSEAQLLVRHYLSAMTTSELFAVMVSGMSAISASLVIAYSSMGVPVHHILTSLMMSIPTSLMIAKIIMPEIERSPEQTCTTVRVDKKCNNVFEAIAAGTNDGLWMAINVGAILIAFLGLIALINYLLSYGSYKVNMIFSYMGIVWRMPLLTLEKMSSFLCAPFGYLLGFTGSEAEKASQLIGIKVVVNELVAYTQLVNMHLSERSTAILTYALCGFSNFSGIGIQIGAIGTLAPEKKLTLTQLGLYAVLGGMLTNLLSAMVVGLIW